MSQSEGGFELVYQSTVVMPHWLLEPDQNGRWETQTAIAAGHVTRGVAQVEIAGLLDQKRPGRCTQSRATAR